MAQRAASYGEAVLHKSLTMKHCFATAPQYEASPVFISLRRGKPFHSAMKHSLRSYDEKMKNESSRLQYNAIRTILWPAIQSFMAGFFYVLILPNEWQVLIAQTLPNREQIEWVTMMSLLKQSGWPKLAQNWTSRNNGLSMNVWRTSLIISTNSRKFASNIFQKTARRLWRVTEGSNYLPQTQLSSWLIVAK